MFFDSQLRQNHGMIGKIEILPVTVFEVGTNDTDFSTGF